MKRYVAPIRFLTVTAVSIFTAEGVIMLLLHLPVPFITSLSPQATGILDASLLTIMVFPVLYVFSFRPLIRHITERERKEEQLQQAHEELRRSHEALEAAQVQLIQAEKMGAIGQLAGGIAHEIKNPLHIIEQGVAYLEEAFSPERGGTSEVLSTMKEAVMRADKIIRGLLDFSRPGQLELKAVAIQQVIDGALELARKELTVRGITVARHLDPDLPLVRLDENQMKQVFINLILNAFQAMPEGGALSLRAYTNTLTKTRNGIGRRSGDVFALGQTVLVCEVADTGQGIPNDHFSKIFDPFFSTKPVGQGTGLGLAISRTIVEDHGGLIDIESQEGQGTRVMLMLPIAEAGRAGAASRSSST